jgi:hypothetical protein
LPEVKELRKLTRRSAVQGDDLRLTRKKLKEAEEDLELANKKLEALEATRGKQKLYKIRKPKNNTPSGDATAIVCCSDWHLEKQIDPAEINGLNEFNLDIAAKRIERLWEKSIYMLRFARGISDIRRLVVWLGGDLIQGHLRDEDREGNFLGPADAILCCQRHIVSGLEYLQAEANVDVIDVECSLGNHSRTTKFMQSSHADQHSWEAVMYGNLAMHFSSNPIINVTPPDGYFSLIDASGYRIRFSHGDAIKFGGGVGGVAIPLKKKIAMWNQGTAVDCDVIGHFHNHEAGWNYIINSSLCGYDSFALRIGADRRSSYATASMGEF